MVRHRIESREEDCRIGSVALRWDLRCIDWSRLERFVSLQTLDRRGIFRKILKSL